MQIARLALHRAPSGDGPAVVERRLADHLDLGAPIDAFDRAHEHVSGVIVRRRSRVGDGGLALLPFAHHERVDHDQPALRGHPRRLQHVRAGQIAAAGGHVDAVGTDAEGPRRAAEMASWRSHAPALLRRRRAAAADLTPSLPRSTYIRRGGHWAQQDYSLPMSASDQGSPAAASKGAEPFAMHPPAARLLAGRSALVTGGDSGIGQAICYELAAHGAAVAINYVGPPDEAHRMVAEIAAAGGSAAAVAMDVSSEQDVERAFGEAREAIGPIDLLVN